MARRAALHAGLAACAACAWTLSTATAAGECTADTPGLCDDVQLLQLDLRTSVEREKVQSSRRAHRDLVMFHMPYNFGHTIEKVALLGPYAPSNLYAIAITDATFGSSPAKLMQPHGEVWGLLDPALQNTSNVTGCWYGWTPPNLWPTQLAQQYFGNKTKFAMIRDPYERLVAQFRGYSMMTGFGGTYASYGAWAQSDFPTCDVNSAIKKVLLSLKTGNISKYAYGCTLVPQAEFFEGTNGVDLAIDNRKFPSSFNTVMQNHGYPQIEIKQSDILHVKSCPEVWAGDLDCQTRKLVQEIYAKDFALLCKEFGYCDKTENTCLTHVQQMCPSNTTKKNTYCP